MNEWSAMKAVEAAEDSATDILVVDDNARNLLAIDAALGDFAGRIVKAKSGEDALRALLKHDYAVILLDVQMPGLDGFETARLIRSRDRCKHTPIIFVTAYDQKHDEVVRGYQLGAVDFLFKPISPEILKAKVAAFVELRKHVAEIARQAKLLREHERREQEDRLNEERRRWEADTLRRVAEENKERAEQLAMIVAERERAQAELTRAVRELEIADRRKNEFLATLAHELRTPLSPIALGVDLLAELLNDATEVTSVLTAMRRQTRHLVRLVDDLLEVSRISQGKIQLRRAPMSLNDAVERAIELCRPLIDERGHRLEVQECSVPVYVDGDRVRLTQVVTNLLTNAARYTPPNGRIQLKCSKHDGHAVLEVVDNGRGMTPDLVERAFDIFEQGESSEETSGLGIGLSLVRDLVVLHGGKVEAQSEGLDRGSTFRVILPLLQEEVAEAQQRAETEAPGLRVSGTQRKLRVLLVEDNEDIRELTSAMLRRGGHIVEMAEEGQSAIALARAEPFDVALIDIGLPGMGGAEVGEALRKILGSSARLVAVTGYGHAEVRNDAAKAGFDAYLIKPVDHADLDAQLRLAANRLAPAEAS